MLMVKKNKQYTLKNECPLTTELLVLSPRDKYCYHFPCVLPDRSYARKRSFDF